MKTWVLPCGESTYRTWLAGLSSWVWDRSGKGREKNENGRRERRGNGDKA